MKLVRLTTFYPGYLKDFYGERPGLVEKSYAEQKDALDYDAFGCAGFWGEALDPLGYEVMEVTLNNEPLQRAWALEKGLPDARRMDLGEITLEQIRSFKPEILWYNHYDAGPLRRIRKEVSTIRLVLGWAGSAIPRVEVWGDLDLVLSCAPESVDWFRKKGIRCKHLNHGFDPRINERLKERGKHIDLSFTGQITRGGYFHLERERVLEELCERVPIRIYSQSADMTFKDEFKAILGKAAFGGMQVFKRLGIPEKALLALPRVGVAALWQEAPMRPVSPQLKPFMKSAVFGLDMYQILRDSKITLNIHADSSPTHASNVRLFEATGVCTCLVTDWKENLPDLFEPEKEVVTYRSSEECVEKVQWLLDNPRELEDIARAGQVRCLKEHTISHRALSLDEIIKKELA